MRYISHFSTTYMLLTQLYFVWINIIYDWYTVNVDIEWIPFMTSSEEFLSIVNKYGFIDVKGVKMGGIEKYWSHGFHKGDHLNHVLRVYLYIPAILPKLPPTSQCVKHQSLVLVWQKLGRTDRLSLFVYPEIRENSVHVQQHCNS